METRTFALYKIFYSLYDYLQVQAAELWDVSAPGRRAAKVSRQACPPVANLILWPFH